MSNLRTVNQVVTVSAVNTAGATYDAYLGDGTLVQGIRTEPQNLPAVGEERQVLLVGAQVVDLYAGIANGSVGDPQVSAVGVGKLSGGTWTPDAVLAGSILSASTGQRAGITPIGLQAWNAANALTVSLDGVTNLMTGTWQTALPGAGTRRIVVGASGSSGTFSIIGADGTETRVEGYLESGVESIRMTNPVDDSWAGWNAVTVQGNEIARISSGQVIQYFGGDTTSGSKQWLVYQASNSGSPGTQPSSTERVKVDNSRFVARAPDYDTSTEITNQTWRTFLGAVSSEGSMDIIRHGVVDSRARSPRLQLRCEGGTSAMNLKAVIDSGGANPRVEVTDTGDNYSNIYAADFHVASSAQIKTDIADLPGTALAKVRTLRGRQYRRVFRESQILGTDEPVVVPEWTGPTEIGLVAEETPPELVSGEGDMKAVSVYGLATLAAVAAKENDDAIDQLRRTNVAQALRIKALEDKVTALMTKLGVTLP